MSADFDLSRHRSGFAIAPASNAGTGAACSIRLDSGALDKESALDASKTTVPPPLTDFLLEFGRLEAVLDGYPIDQLLQFVSHDVTDSGTGRSLVDQCLASWITALDSALASMPTTGCDAFVHIGGRQRGARDALVRLRSKLPPAYGERGHRGPLT